MIKPHNTYGENKAEKTQHRFLPLVLLISSLAFTSLSHAQASPVSNQQLYLTIYNKDLALVEDRRNVILPQGRSSLEFKDVSAGIRPETVALQGQGVSIVEQNFDFDLLTPDKLMEKSLGQQVQLVRTNPGNGQQTTESAKVLSVNQGVVLDVGGRIEVLRADAIPTRVIFNKIPENLRAHPTLSINVESDKAGSRDLNLSYLTKGLSWQADYVALFDEKLGRLDLQGWITLTNNSGTTFNNVNARLVAGDIRLSNNEGEYYSYWRTRSQTRRATNAKGGEERKPALADYYLYPLPERTTIADKQTKQIGFMDTNGVKAKKIYEYRAQSYQSMSNPEHASVVVQFNNSVASGLDEPLPAGIVRVYMRDPAGKPAFVGESAIEHTPQGSEVSVRTGEAFDITVQGFVKKEERPMRRSTRYTMEYNVHSAANQPVNVELVQSSYWTSRKVISENFPSKRVDAYNIKWSIPVNANSESTLNFVVEETW